MVLLRTNGGGSREPKPIAENIFGSSYRFVREPPRGARASLALMAMMWVGCQPATTPNTNESARTQMSASAPVSVPVSTPVRPAPTISFDEAWNLVRAHTPEKEIAGLSLMPWARIEDLLSWAPPDGTVTVFDRACRPHSLRRGDKALYGPANVEIKIEGNTKYVHTDDIVFGFSVTELCGTDLTYERNLEGKWELSTTNTVGCASNRLKLLSKVTPDEAWYDGEAVSISVHCCHGGETRVCSVCEQLGIKNVRGEHRQYGNAGVVEHLPPVEDADCGVPCPPDPIGEKVTAINTALAKATFQRTDGASHPEIFRTLAACRTYRRTHRIGPDEINSW